GQVTNTATITPPAGIPNTLVSCTSLPAPNARSFNAGTGACSASDTDNVIPASCFLGNPATNQAYPYGSGTTATTFNESTVLKRFEPTIAQAGGTIRVWYSNEHALAMGVRQYTDQVPTPDVVTTYPVTTFPKTNAGMIALGAPSGTKALSAGVDAAGNPVPAWIGGPVS